MTRPICGISTTSAGRETSNSEPWGYAGPDGLKTASLALGGLCGCLSPGDRRTDRRGPGVVAQPAAAMEPSADLALVGSSKAARTSDVSCAGTLILRPSGEAVAGSLGSVTAERSVPQCEDDLLSEVEGVARMRATVMYGAGDVRVERRPRRRLIEPTDALVRVHPSRDLRQRSVAVQVDGSPRRPAAGWGTSSSASSRRSAPTSGRSRRAISSSLPSSGRTAPASSAARACRPPACTAAVWRRRASTAVRAKRCASRRRMARSSCCPSPRTTR